ncbi:MAG: hypothetical protein ABIJ09_16070 [Pseudomonadota bacterium]
MTRPTTVRSEETFGSKLQRRREELGLGLEQLASRLDYKDPGRGATKVHRWEEGSKLPTGKQRGALDQALELPTGTVQSWLDDSSAPVQRQARLGADSVAWNLGLLRDHLPLLLDAEPEILARPAWRDICLSGASYVLLHLAAGSFSLGQLLTGWRTGDLIFPGTDGGELRLLSVSGSAFSGMRELSGLTASGEPGSGQFKGLTASDVRKRIPREPENFAQSAWSLGQLISSLGGTVPDISVEPDGGGEVLRYVHPTSSLVDASGASTKVALGDPVLFEDIPRGRTKVRIGTWPLAPSLTPGGPSTFKLIGGMREPRLTLEVDGKRWTYGGGLLSSDSAGSAFWFDGDPSPVLLATVALSSGLTLKTPTSLA